MVLWPPPIDARHTRDLKITPKSIVAWSPYSSVTGFTMSA
jgi:hypothetical protein